MAVKVAINGFGRIGRLALRAALESGRDDVEFVAINDLGAPEVNAHLLQYDSVHGRFPGEVKAVENGISVDGKVIRSFAERNPEDLPWGELGVDVVMECTGIFTSKEKAGCMTTSLATGVARALVPSP